MTPALLAQRQLRQINDRHMRLFCCALARLSGIWQLTDYIHYAEELADCATAGSGDVRFDYWFIDKWFIDKMTLDQIDRHLQHHFPAEVAWTFMRLWQAAPLTLNLGENAHVLFEDALTAVVFNDSKPLIYNYITWQIQTKRVHDGFNYIGLVDQIRDDPIHRNRACDIYQRGAFDELRVFADELEEKGATDQLVAHLRSQPYFRGFWSLDYLRHADDY